MFVKLSLICNDVNKIFITELKVLKNLPYEIILGRQVMKDQGLMLGNSTLTNAPKCQTLQQ
jgi:hypothetical protein